MCGCRVRESIADRPIHPKLGRSPPPVVLVMTRPWYVGLKATRAPDGSVNVSTSACSRRKATSDSNRPLLVGAAGRSAAMHPAAATQSAPSVISRPLEDFPHPDIAMQMHMHRV